MTWDEAARERTSSAYERRRRRVVLNQLAHSANLRVESTNQAKYRYFALRQRIHEHFSSGPRAEVRRSRGLIERNARDTMRVVNQYDARIQQEEIMAKAAKSKAKTAAADAPVPTKTRTKREKQPCVCGCGTPTNKFFAPGHDARLKGQLRRLEAGKSLKDSGMERSVYNRLKKDPGFETREVGSGDNATEGQFLQMEWANPNDVAAVLRG